MKKFFQLAGGIALAAVFLGVIYYSVIAYDHYKQRIATAEAIEDAKQQELKLFQQNMLKVQRRVLKAQRQKAIEDRVRQAEEERKLTYDYRRRQNERAREEQRRIEQQQLDEQERRKAIAWEKYYTLPDMCNQTVSKRNKDWCFKHRVEAKFKFDKLWDKGLEAK